MAKMTKRADGRFQKKITDPKTKKNNVFLWKKRKRG